MGPSSTLPDGTGVLAGTSLADTLQIRAQLAVASPALGGETGFSCGISKRVLSLQFCDMCLALAAGVWLRQLAVRTAGLQTG